MIDFFSLKRCPVCFHCGAMIEKERRFYIKCGSCGFESPKYETPTEATEYWNRDDNFKIYFRK